MHTLLTLYLGIAVSEWERRLVVECNEVDGFHLPAVTYAADNAKESISHNDLLLLSKEKVKWSLIVFAFNFYISMHFNIQFLSIFFLSGGFALCLSHCVSVYSFLKMGFFEKVYLLFHFFSFFWGGGGEGTFGKQCIWVYIVPCFVSYKIFEKGKINLGALQG